MQQARQNTYATLDLMPGIEILTIFLPFVYAYFNIGYLVALGLLVAAIVSLRRHDQRKALLLLGLIPVILITSYSFFYFTSPARRLEKQAQAISYPLFSIPDQKDGFSLHQTAVITNDHVGPIISMDYYNPSDPNNGFVITQLSASQLINQFADKTSHDLCGSGPMSPTGFKLYQGDLECTKVAELHDGTPVYVPANFLIESHPTLYITRQGTRIELRTTQASEKDLIAALDTLRPITKSDLNFDDYNYRSFKLDTLVTKWTKNILQIHQNR
jgi:hypothetical protein